MSKLLRHHGPNQHCFITVVTSDRKPLLCRHIDLLLTAVRRAKRKSWFSLVAWVVLPDHTHAILYSPAGETARIVQRIKLSFSLQLRSLTHTNGIAWQHRYWDHVIRTEEDFKRHLDYIHYNPVKHGLVSSPAEWELSSFRRYMRDGYYSQDWGEREPLVVEGLFGE